MAASQKEHAALMIGVMVGLTYVQEKPALWEKCNTRHVQKKLSVVII